ncbi:hypothetical protein SLEP1_g51052 [Rubroshorea leprosula]|uniref:glycerophosphodiester phosphodiesterase n=1 Tax=Rubroshorea leprosula TaxID=152421 RepID=A0AAV5M3E5_9ROSI|nr:hypothetical protein SLEP1_g51052 [Rubroshorea leprosula]
MCCVRNLCIALLLLHSVAVALVSAQGSNSTSRWQTLSGDAPLVIARGGFSGMFPDSSLPAYELALLTSVPDVILWCDVQLTKDGFGICFPNPNLENSTNIGYLPSFNNQQKVYQVDDGPVKGWFSVDYTFSDLGNFSLTQGIYRRTPQFDRNLLKILTVQDVAHRFNQSAFWLNVQYDAFYTQHNLSMRNFVLNVSKSVIVDYISSPEVGFLRSILVPFASSKTKLVFRFMQQDDIEPSTNQSYRSLLGNLTFIKKFASGIIVPKSYIWPVDSSNYLLTSTSVVSDAHKVGLEVFASDFANDAQLSFNYSYDPLAEYLNFIDNGDFSVDGVISDFPITPSEAIGKLLCSPRQKCFKTRLYIFGPTNSPKVLLDTTFIPCLVVADLLIITKYGASGDYPGCTDLAYSKAIVDGADVIDCPVQMTKDGIPICLQSINLFDSTNVAQSSFSNLVTTIPGIQADIGIFTFTLTWSEIQTLKPSISSPQGKNDNLFRNPNFKNAGKFVTLSDFLATAKNASSLSGVLISIENAAYLATEQGLSVTDAVLSALSKAGYDKVTTPKVMIQSSNSSVLKKVNSAGTYELVYRVDQSIRDALNATVEDIKSFAHSVVVDRTSVFPMDEKFVTGTTDVVTKLQSFKLPVYVETFSNEFISQPWDFFSDATVQINTFYKVSGLNGVITDFPKTAARYRRNRYLGKGKETPRYMIPAPPGFFMGLIAPAFMPPADAPYPVLTVQDVVEPPLPDAVAKSPSTSPAGSPSTSPPPNEQPKVTACVFVSNLAMLLVVLLLF